MQSSPPRCFLYPSSTDLVATSCILPPLNHKNAVTSPAPSLGLWENATWGKFLCANMVVRAGSAGWP